MFSISGDRYPKPSPSTAPYQGPCICCTSQQGPQCVWRTVQSWGFLGALRFVEVEDNMQHVKQALQETRAKTDEMTDHESRRNNIIIYNVPEVSGPTSDISYNSDMYFCMQLFTALVTGCAKEDIKRLTTLGQ